MTNNNQEGTMTEEDQNQFITDIVAQVADVVGVELSRISRVEIRPGELDVTRFVDIGEDEEGGVQRIRVTDTIPWMFVPAETE